MSPPRVVKREDLIAVYKAWAAQYARQYGIPEEIFLKHIERESQWDPKKPSPVGALGLGQFMPATAKSLNIDPLNPRQSLEGSARYLKAQYTRFGTWPLAVAAYNAGPTEVAKFGIRFPETKAHLEYVFGSQSPSSKFTRPVPKMDPKPITPDQEQLQTLYSGGMIEDVFDTISVPFFYTAGFLQTPDALMKKETSGNLVDVIRGTTDNLRTMHEQGLRGMRNRTEWIRWMEKEYPQTRNTMVTIKGAKIPYSTVAGTLMNLAADPTNLVGAGLVKGTRGLIAQIPKLEKFLGVKLSIPLVTELLNNPNKIMLKKYEQLYDRMLIDRQSLFDLAHETLSEVLKLPKIGRAHV